MKTPVPSKRTASSTSSSVAPSTALLEVASSRAAHPLKLGMLHEALHKDNTQLNKLMRVLLLTGGLAIAGHKEVQAQAVVNRDANTGGVSVNRNAYTIDTGDLTNNSSIPLPVDVPAGTASGQTIPTTTDGTLAPNSVILGTDLDYIRENFGSVINSGAAGPTFTLQNGSVNVTTELNLNQDVGNHAFGEGIEVRVLDTDGNVVPGASVVDGNGQPVTRAFVRGDGVTRGPDGQLLNTTESLFVTYEEGERIEIQLLNLRSDNAAATESGAYFDASGNLIVEDLQGGGDKDFNDGDYLNVRMGVGEAIAIEDDVNVTFSTRTDETLLEPEIRRELLVEEGEIETIETVEDIVLEEIDRGRVEIPELSAARLTHAVGVRTEAGEQLVYNRYAGTGQIRAGSDGFSAAGQLAPLVENPSAPPTLLSGELTFNPFVGDGEAGLVGSVSVTQFLSRTHRLATDALGNDVQTGQSDRLLEPTGLFNNRRLVGYVPDRSGEVIKGEQLSSDNGVFQLPTNSAVMIAPPNPWRVGVGNSAYTRNVGGLLIEQVGGEMVFVPQWDSDEYAREPISLAPGEARRAIYALVPQQPDQNLRVGQTYEVTQGVEGGAEGYQIVEGGFRIISADQQPQNFLKEAEEVYAVEDTIAAQNAATAVFNGIQGLYTEFLSGDRTSTVDLDDPGEADARVGNEIYPILASDGGQRAYARTTRAFGLYVGASLTGGIGNQQDTVTRRRSTISTATDQRRSLETINIFSTPASQIETTTVETTERSQRTGTATFEINTEGLLENPTFSPTSTVLFDPERRDIDTTTITQTGEEVLVESTTEEVIETLSTRTDIVEADTTTDTDSYANAAPVDGEIAFGGVFNFGNTPWTPAANTLRAELFLKNTLFGRDREGTSAGWRASAIFHPFGERQRAAYQYNLAGEAVPLYKTEPVIDANGEPVVEMMTAANGEMVAVPVNQFVTEVRTDAGGTAQPERIVETVGTGRSKGPGLYVRMQDTWSDNDGVMIDGGIQLSF